MGSLLLLGPLAWDHLGIGQLIGAVSPPQSEKERVDILSPEPSEYDDDFPLGQ